MKLPTLNHFTYIIHSITPSKTENERDFSLAGIYTASRHTNLSVEMLSDIILINRNSTALGCNTPIDVFGGSLDAVYNIDDETEINPYDFDPFQSCVRVYPLSDRCPSHTCFPRNSRTLHLHFDCCRDTIGKNSTCYVRDT